jgi:hypothetical protein
MRIQPTASFLQIIAIKWLSSLIIVANLANTAPFHPIQLSAQLGTDTLPPLAVATRVLKSNAARDQTLDDA